MAKKIIFKYDDMNSTADNISEYAKEYTTAATTLIKELDDAMSDWEGNSKDKFSRLINGDVNTYVATTIPAVIQGLSDMLKSNAEQMKNADDNIAGQIQQNL